MSADMHPDRLGAEVAALADRARAALARAEPDPSRRSPAAAIVRAIGLTPAAVPWPLAQRLAQCLLPARIVPEDETFRWPAPDEAGVPALVFPLLDGLTGGVADLVACAGSCAWSRTGATAWVGAPDGAEPVLTFEGALFWRRWVAALAPLYRAGRGEADPLADAGPECFSTLVVDRGALRRPLHACVRDHPLAGARKIVVAGARADAEALARALAEPPRLPPLPAIARTAA